MGGRFHLRLNTNEKPIANKYREGKLKRTLERGSKVREIADREPIGSAVSGSFCTRTVSGLEESVDSVGLN